MSYYEQILAKLNSNKNDIKDTDKIDFLINKCINETNNKNTNLSKKEIVNTICAKISSYNNIDISDINIYEEVDKYFKDKNEAINENKDNDLIYRTDDENSIKNNNNVTKKEKDEDEEIQSKINNNNDDVLNEKHISMTDLNNNNNNKNNKNNDSNTNKQKQNVVIPFSITKEYLVEYLRVHKIENKNLIFFSISDKKFREFEKIDKIDFDKVKFKKPFIERQLFNAIDEEDVINEENVIKNLTFELKEKNGQFKIKNFIKSEKNFNDINNTEECIKLKINHNCVDIYIIDELF